ncbi:hypothetical protein [Blastococcus sp. SYSU D01042]
MTDLTTPRAPEQPAPDPGIPEQRGAPGARAVTAPANPPAAAAVELTRLLALARLTAPQAVELAAGLLTAVADDGDPGAVHPVLTADGRVALDASPADERPVDAVLAGIAAAAGLPGATSTPAAERLLAGLDGARAVLAADGPAAAARALHVVGADVDGPAVRAELAALARTIGRLPTGTGGQAVARPRPAPTGTRTSVRRPRRPRSAGRRVGAWLLSLVVLGAVVTAEVVLLGDDITADIDLLLDAGRGGEQEEAEPEPDGLPVTPPAPPSAGNVTGVDLRPLAACAPGAPCAVRVLVRVAPSPEPQVVTWSYRVVDRCTGTSTTLPGGSVTVPPQADRAAVVGEVPLPPLAGVAVLVVTEAPAVAASAPVSAGSCLPAGPDA